MHRSHDERRAHPRVVRAVEVHGLPEAGGEPICLEPANLSLGGVYCTSNREFPEMTRLAVRLVLDGDATRPIEAGAVVVRHARTAERFELALLFTDMAPTDRLRLARFLA